uniref:Uncharacterized bone marrow protein BM029 n=1 Tax=Homo sapiens TaxID=9606 RepID=Q9NZ92_HUMAN|nr:uncharacterized bone marrow protein BM029 [Homo sapiens]
MAVVLLANLLRGTAWQLVHCSAEGQYRQPPGLPRGQPCRHSVPAEQASLLHMQNPPFEPTSVDMIAAGCRACLPWQGGREPLRVYSVRITAVGHLGITVDELIGFTSHL